MSNYVRIKKFCELTGWSESWVRKRISRQVWRENEQYFYTPGNRIVISIKGYEAWVEMGTVSGLQAKLLSKSVLPIEESVVVKGSGSSPPPLT